MASSSRSMQSGSSSSSYLSSSLAVPSLTRTNSHLTQTPTSSAVSAATYELSFPATTLPPLDLGPPGYQATITLFERTPHERTVYLGPWEVLEGDTRRVVWQSSYKGETLEQFLPLGLPAQLQPITLHGQHRRYSDPAETELYLTFREPCRIRYTGADGTVVHDKVVDVKYDFTSIDGSMRFQGDLRRQDLVDFFDVDVVFSDTHGRTDSLTGAVRGLATIQRIKLWRDRLSLHHCLTFYSDKPASRRERRFREYQLSDFQEDLRSRDDKHKECRLAAAASRAAAAAPNAVRANSFSISSPSSWRSKQRPPERRGSDSRHAASTTTAVPLDIRWLGIRFTRESDYRRFVDRWTIFHGADGELQGMPLPSNIIELPSPALRQGHGAFALDAPEAAGRLPGVPSVLDEPDTNITGPQFTDYFPL